MKIYFDAGHGGFGVTPGKRTPDNEYEWDFNNKVALAFEEEMSKYEGVQLYRTDDRSGRTDVPLVTRTNMAKNGGASLYLSFHHNAHKGVWGDHTGVETYNNDLGLALAAELQESQVKAYGLRDRGLKRANLHITRVNAENKIPAVLLEGGFMDSRIDILKLRDDKVLHKAGVEVAKTVASFYGLKKRKGGKTKPKPSKPAEPNPIESKGVDTLAREVIAGKYGNGEARKKALGRRYSEVQKRVDDILKGSQRTGIYTKGVDTLAREVLAGKHGNGDARRRSLGSRYAEVQARVNVLSGRPASQPSNTRPVTSFEKLVRDTIAGKYGNGEARKKALGEHYKDVQSEVNRRLK